MWRPEKVPRGADELILYLDFDGVLHHENCLWSAKRGPYLSAPEGFVLFQHSALLSEILAPYPQVKVVLSTSWVRSYGCDNAAKRLPKTLYERVIGATFHSRMNPNDFVSSPRGMQVWGDVFRRKPKDWLAIDDDYLHWPKWCLEKYIQTHEHHGVSEPSVETRLRSSLERMCSAN